MPDKSLSPSMDTDPSAPKAVPEPTKEDFDKLGVIQNSPEVLKMNVVRSMIQSWNSKKFQGTAFMTLNT